MQVSNSIIYFCYTIVSVYFCICYTFVFVYFCICYTVVFVIFLFLKCCNVQYSYSINKKVSIEHRTHLKIILFTYKCSKNGYFFELSTPFFNILGY